jgi:hypothetical protein
MVVLGRVQNGVVMPESNSALSEGPVVTISYGEPPAKQAAAGASRVQVPLVQTGRPASVHLTGERFTEILDKEDAAP